MLVAGLPEDSLLHRHNDERSSDRWTLQTELTAQLIEEVSILAAEKRRKEPRQVPRPSYLRSGKSKPQGQASPDAYSRAIGVLQGSARKVVTNR